MAQIPDLAKLQQELVDAFEWGEESRARALISQLSERPRQARALLDEMLGSPDPSVRRAAAFGLGELGGGASAKRLEQQMALEESRGDHDGASVLEVITRALGRIKDAGARASLVRRLQRLVTGKPAPTDVNEVAYALWRKRHPELIPVVRGAMGQLTPKDAWALRALLRLLETPPKELASWAMDESVAPGLKADVLAILDEEVPEGLLPAIPAFITAAMGLEDLAVNRKGEASVYCDRLFTTLLLHLDQILPALPAEIRDDLRALTRKCVAAVDLGCAMGAASVLRYVGRPEDATLLDAHRPADPTFAKVFDEAAHALRNLRRE